MSVLLHVVFHKTTEILHDTGDVVRYFLSSVRDIYIQRKRISCLIVFLT